METVVDDFSSPVVVYPLSATMYVVDKIPFQPIKEAIVTTALATYGSTVAFREGTKYLWHKFKLTLDPNYITILCLAAEYKQLKELDKFINTTTNVLMKEYTQYIKTHPTLSKETKQLYRNTFTSFFGLFSTTLQFISFKNAIKVTGEAQMEEEVRKHGLQAPKKSVEEEKQKLAREMLEPPSSTVNCLLM